MLALDLETAIAQSIQIKDRAVSLENTLKQSMFWTENPEIATLSIYQEGDRIRTFASFSSAQEKQDFASRADLSLSEVTTGDKLEIFLWGKTQNPYLAENTYHRPPNVEQKAKGAIAALESLKNWDSFQERKGSRKTLSSSPQVKH